MTYALKGVILVPMTDFRGGTIKSQRVWDLLKVIKLINGVIRSPPKSYDSLWDSCNVSLSWVFHCPQDVPLGWNSSHKAIKKENGVGQVKRRKAIRNYARGQVEGERGKKKMQQETALKNFLKIVQIFMFQNVCLLVCKYQSVVTRDLAEGSGSIVFKFSVQYLNLRVYGTFRHSQFTAQPTSQSVIISVMLYVCKYFTASKAFLHIEADSVRTSIIFPFGRKKGFHRAEHNCTWM